MKRAIAHNLPNTAILISGVGSNMQALARAAQQPGYPTRIGLVVSSKPNAKGLAAATALSLPTQVINPRTFQSREDFEDNLHAALIFHHTHLIALAGYMEILSTRFINKWQGRILNIHPSLLPEYKGLNTHQRVLEAGDEVTGCTVHQVTPAVDDGPILGQLTVPVCPGDTPKTLEARVKEAEHRLYPAVLATFAESLAVHAL
jgi:phosphoribosylglycinamide formyltransferase-1